MGCRMNAAAKMARFGTFRRVNTPTHAMLPPAKQLRFETTGEMG